MLPSFYGTVTNGKLVIPELAQRESFLEGKHLAVSALSLDSNNCIVGGNVVAGVYDNDKLQTLNSQGNALNQMEGSQVIVVVRHELVENISPGVFDERYQLGAKLGDVDD